MVRVVTSTLRLWLLALSWTALACGDLEDFGGTYGGPIVKGSFVRSCFSDTTQATLVFEPDRALPRDDGLQGTPNTLSTSDGVFQQTPLEPIRSLSNDHLSLLDFPGPQRLRNYLLLARPSEGPLAGRDAVVVVSLLASEDVEVRVMARTADGTAACAASPDGTEIAPPTEGGAREYFGFFRMKKQ